MPSSASYARETAFVASQAQVLEDPGWSGATLAALLVLGFVLLWTFIAGLRFAAWRGERHAARSRRVGERGERRALRLLRREGYRVLEHQPKGVTRALIDGELRGFPVRADALVRRRRRVYVAEFKGAERSARVENRFTRRQLLEYTLAFEADGVLLVDAARGRVVTVQFLGPGALEDDFVGELEEELEDGARDRGDHLLDREDDEDEDEDEGEEDEEEDENDEDDIEDAEDDELDPDVEIDERDEPPRARRRA